MPNNSEATHARLRAELMELHQSFITRSVDNRRSQGVRNEADSIASVAHSLREFDKELQMLSDNDRNAIESAFRNELAMMLLQFRLEIARIYFVG
jgi:hypothetical protein